MQMTLATPSGHRPSNLPSRPMFMLVLLLLGLPNASAEDWLQWAGPNGDFTVNATGLADSWPSEGPRQLWKRPLGDGYSSILCKDDRLFTEYRDGEDSVVACLDSRTGKTQWESRYRHKIWPDMEKSFGLGPNTTPLIVGDRIISISIDGQMRCHDLASGSVQWEHNLPSEFGRRKRVEEYGYSGIPLPYERTAIVLVGGDNHAVVAFDPETGAAVWKSEAGGVSYAPPTITKLAGREQFIYFEPEGVVALDPSTGRTLWRSAIEFDNGNHLTPIVKCDDNHIWVGSQFLTGGGRLLELTASAALRNKGAAESAPLLNKEGVGGSKEAAPFEVKQIWFDKKLRASHWTSIRIGDYIYGSIGGNDVSFLAAFDWRTGKIAWRPRGFHKAQCLYADGKLLLLDETGQLALARVSPQKLQVLAKAQVTDSVSWTLPTLVGTTLYVRDRKHILALDLSQGTP